MEYLAARSQETRGFDDSRLNNRQRAKLIWQGSRSARLIYCSPPGAENPTAEAMPKPGGKTPEGTAHRSGAGGRSPVPLVFSRPARIKSVYKGIVSWLCIC